MLPHAFIVGSAELNRRMGHRETHRQSSVHGTIAFVRACQPMQRICPKDSDVSEYMGHKLRIYRAGEEFVGVVTGWADVDGARPWMLVADNASMTFLPSEGWEVHDCTAEKANSD
jgi:hypothetical protein